MQNKINNDLAMVGSQIPVEAVHDTCGVLPKCSGAS